MLRELSHRAADNGRIEVSLDWDSDTNDVVLTLVDDDGAKQIAVSGTNALDAFEHPYAYMAGARQLLTPIAR